MQSQTNKASACSDTAHSAAHALRIRRCADDVSSAARDMGISGEHRIDQAELFAVVGILNCVATRLEAK